MHGNCGFKCGYNEEKKYKAGGLLEIGGLLGLGREVCCCIPARKLVTLPATTTTTTEEPTTTTRRKTTTTTTEEPTTSFEDESVGHPFTVGHIKT